MNLLPVILAGGGGSRLWPLSRAHYPKQFLAVNGARTLLQNTLTRLDRAGLSERGIAVSSPMVVCNEAHRFMVGEQARQIDQSLHSIVLEPIGRNTAPALTCAALIAQEQGDDPYLLMMPADQLVADVEAFNAALVLATELAESERLVTFGVVPDKAETGYGYIQLGAALQEGEISGHQIASFKEKPDHQTASDYLNSGSYRWNAGIFLMRASLWLGAIESFEPAIAAAAKSAVKSAAVDGEFTRLGAAAFEECPGNSIDYAVMEPAVAGSTFDSAVVSLDVGWSDVGSWSSLWEVSEHDDAGNFTRGDVYLDDCTNNAVIAEHRLVATVGCSNLVVVETPDAVLVADKSHSQDVKKIVDWLGGQKREEHLFHRRVYRPWGSYEAVDAGDRFQVKRIIVNPGASLSLQMHHHRAEHWIVVSGTAKVTCNDSEFLLSENESTYIPVGATHRLENPGAIACEIIEVQSGSYLGEDDIVRFEDRYNRV